MGKKEENRVPHVWFECACCPQCEHQDLEYGESYQLDLSLIYPFTCSECGFKGREVYGVEFSHMANENGQMKLEKGV